MNTIYAFIVIIGIIILFIVGVVVMLNYKKAVDNEIERQNREKERNAFKYNKQ